MQALLSRRTYRSTNGGSSGAGLVGGVPSVLVSREMVASGRVAAQLKLTLDECSANHKCERQELYHAITGQSNSADGRVPAAEVSVSPGMRTSMLHWVTGNWNVSAMEAFYSLGDHSYLSESAYAMRDGTWKRRYWGDTNYARLREVKAKWDPQGVFWCHHCVGSDD